MHGKVGGHYMIGITGFNKIQDMLTPPATYKKSQQ